MQQAERLRDDHQRQAKQMARAVVVIQATVKRRQQRLREEKQVQQEIARRKIAEEATASARLQRSWRRHKAAQVLDRRRREPNDTPVRSPLTADNPETQPLTTQTLPGSRSLEDDHHPKAPGASSRTLLKKGDDPLPAASSREASTNDRREPTSWENWSSAIEVNPSLADEMGRGGGEDAAAENARPWTAAGAVESSASTPPPPRPKHPSPPAGMMTVTVRRGVEETSVVTPIVLTESGGEDADATATPPAVPASAAGGGLSVAAGLSSSPGEEGQSGRAVQPSAVPLTKAAAHNTAAKGVSAVVGGGVVDAPGTHTARPVARGGAAAGKGEFLAVAVAAAESARASANSDAAPSAPTTRFAEPTAGDQSSPLLPPPTAVVVMPENGIPTLQLAAQAAAGASPARAASTTTSREWSDGDSRTIVKPAEQLFMEDTQVYLGCVACGVKYLVEAVEPGPVHSTKGDGQRLGLGNISCVCFTFPTGCLETAVAFKGGGSVRKVVQLRRRNTLFTPLLSSPTDDVEIGRVWTCATCMTLSPSNPGKYIRVERPPPPRTLFSY